MLAVNKSSNFNISAKETAQQLGWIDDSHVQCGGYYRDPLSAFANTTLPPLDTMPVDVNAEQSELHQANASFLRGQVELKQPGRLVNADSVVIKRDAKTGDITDADLKGNVTFRQPDQMVVAESGHIALVTRAASLFNALYHLMVTTVNSTASTETAAKKLNAWGKANAVTQAPSGNIELKSASYTTCAPTAESWRLSAKNIVLDRAEGRGTAHNAWLSIKGIPILYTPFFNFPIDDRRKSGFLFPSASSSTLSGIGVALPYYWNIAPNYDAVITPRYFSKRGLQMNGMLRYLTENSSGTFTAGFIPHDAVFNTFQDESVTKYQGNPALGRLLHSSNNRTLFVWEEQRKLAPRWTTKIDYNYVSDDYYLEDFGRLNTLTPYQLPRHFNINYAGDVWNFSTKFQSYQTLHLINQTAVSNPYNTLPEINFNGNFTNLPYGLNIQSLNQFVYFERPSNPGETATPQEALRVHLQPGLSWPVAGLAGYITPNLQIAATHYNIGYQLAGNASEIQRVLPLFNVDAGLHFFRNTLVGSKGYQQTLEPRIFYLFVPYRRQDQIPLFDTSLIPFSYNSLFLTNRFSGHDRIGDANQLAFALTTRLLEQATGAEKFRASIGQIYYMQNRKVSLCGTASQQNAIVNPQDGSTCANPIAIVGSTSNTEKTSPLAGQLYYRFNPQWSSTSNVAWDPNSNDFISGDLNFNYQPKRNHIINFNYNYIRFGDLFPSNTLVPQISHRNDLNQLGISYAWPIKENWQAVAGWNYNISHQYPQTYFYGLQYDSCCWAIRLVSGRAFSSINQNGNPVFNNTVYLQWQLKGLGTVGTNDAAGLLTSIPGYQDSMQSNRSI